MDNELKRNALEYCDMKIDVLARAINEERGTAEDRELWKKSGRMWKYVRELVRKDLGGGEA